MENRVTKLFNMAFEIAQMTNNQKIEDTLRLLIDSSPGGKLKESESMEYGLKMIVVDAVAFMVDKYDKQIIIKNDFIKDMMIAINNNSISFSELQRESLVLQKNLILLCF